MQVTIKEDNKMFTIVIKDRFFNGGRSFNQLIGVEETLIDAIKLSEEFVINNPQFKHHSIMVEEIFSDVNGCAVLKPFRI
jgi:hypothetical protein